MLAASVDYAGLFPPARQDMATAVASYDRHGHEPESWMLGRFVVPAGRLSELAEAHRAHAGERAPWHLSVLIDGTAPAADLARVGELNAAPGARLVVDVIEAKLAAGADAAAIAGLARAVQGAGRFELYVELPAEPDPVSLLRAIGAVHASAKVRTGGITAGAFPGAGALARFIRRCAECGVPFKATAGLHHPLRACHRLTYEPDAPSGWMFGFLNVLLAAALAHAGAEEQEIVASLELPSAEDVAFHDTGVRWRDRRLSTTLLRESRRALLRSFGSCSFEEPVRDLRTLGLL